MKPLKPASKAKSDTPSKQVDSSRIRKIRIGTESVNKFFARARNNARKLDDGAPLPLGIRISFEDPADFLEVITPARVRLLRKILGEPVPLHALAASLARDLSAVRRDIAVLEGKSIVRTRKVPNPGHGMKTLVERVAVKIEVATTI